MVIPTRKKDEVLDKKIPLATPHMCGKEMEYIQEAFDTNWIAPLGPQVDAFEREIAAVTGRDHAAALSSGTGAMHLALLYLGVGPGDYVFSSTLTFAATCNPILYVGATPVFIDSEPLTWNMSPKALEKAFETYPHPKAVITVNLYGQSSLMDEIVAICDAHNVPLLEDAAESLGTTYKGKPSGSFGYMSILSFNGNKIITTSGGGMLVSNDEEAIKKARFLATQAREKERWYEHTEIGFNYRMSSVCAAIGRGQLTVLADRVQKKRAIFKMYEDGFKDLDVIHMQPMHKDNVSNCWLSTMTFDGVDPIKVMEHLEQDNIESRPIWKPMHLQPLYNGAPFVSELDTGSTAENIFDIGICLPSDTKMTEEEQQRVIGSIHAFFK